MESKPSRLRSPTTAVEHSGPAAPPSLAGPRRLLRPAVTESFAALFLVGRLVVPYLGFGLPADRGLLDLGPSSPLDVSIETDYREKGTSTALASK